MSEFKKFDTQTTSAYFNVRLAKDAEVKDFGDNKLVKLTFVSSSRQEADEEMWIEANPSRRDGVLASYLEKGDVVSFSDGQLTFRRYGEDKIGFNLRNATVRVDMITMSATLKERGWTPGGEEYKGDAPAAPVKKGPGRPKGATTSASKPAKPVKKTIPIEIDLDDEEAEGEE